MYVQVSDSEMLLDDSLRLARRAHIYDVEVSVDIWRKVPHVWQAMGFLPESREALEKAGTYIRNHVI
jgi:acetyl esterase/lipase